MDAVDSYIPTPDRKSDLPFLMPIEDVMTISGRGTVVTGRVERGQLNAGDEVEIIGLTEERKKTVVTSMEMFRKTLDFCEAGDNVGALLRGIGREEVERGQVLCKPSSTVRFTFLLKKRAAVILRSSTTIVRSSTSELPTLPA